MLRRRKALLGLALMVAMVSVFAAPGVGATSFSSGGGDYYHPYPTNVQPGDLVFGHSDLLSLLLPGYWTHVGMIIGWSDTYNDWLVIEAMPDTGVHITTLSTFLSRYPTVAIERVATTDTIRYNAVQFALQQLGKPYNWDYFTKPQVYDDKYYCSQLVWAAYMAASGGTVNLDENPGWSWTYGYAVAPQEIYDDSWTYVIYYDSS